MPNLEGIDAETAKRLQSCLDCEFACSPLRYFLTRKATFLACSKKPLSIRISGFSEPFQSRQLTCCNIDNPEDLEVSMDSCEMLFLPARDPGVLYLKEGMCSVSGPKRSDLAREIDRPARLLDELPRRDPDVVRMDERTFRQTGTISIQSPFTLVILDGQPGAAKL
ncbi:MAG: hypothetical protein STSR0001_26590 [Methanothrix sp.]